MIAAILGLEVGQDEVLCRAIVPDYQRPGFRSVQAHLENWFLQVIEEVVQQQGAFIFRNTVDACRYHLINKDRLAA